MKDTKLERLALLNLTQAIEKAIHERDNCHLCGDEHLKDACESGIMEKIRRLIKLRN